MEGKTIADYKAVFKYMKKKWPKMKPTLVICDYEKALHKALREIFGTTVKGCYFHFAQVIYNMYILYIFISQS